MALTRATRWGALALRQRLSAASSSLKAIAKPAFREPAPLVILVRAFAVAKGRENVQDVVLDSAEHSAGLRDHLRYCSSSLDFIEI